MDQDQEKALEELIHFIENVNDEQEQKEYVEVLEKYHNYQEEKDKQEEKYNVMFYFFFVINE